MTTTRRLQTASGPASLLLLAALLLSGCEAQRAFKDAEKQEARQHWDLAVLAYQKAVELDPDSNTYKLGLTRAKLRAAQVHLEKGKLYRASGQLELSRVELEQSLALDPTNDSCRVEMKRVDADIEARRRENEGETPVEKAKAKTRGARASGPMLNPASTKPIDLAFPQETNVKKIYQFLATAAGINIIFDPQLKDDKYAIDLRGIPFQKALETVMRQAGHFYKVLDEKTIIVAQDTKQNRQEYEDLVIRTFFLSNGDVKDVSAMVRSILDLRRLALIPQLNAIVIRDTADKVSVAERIIEVNDKAKSEVLIDVELIQINTQKMLELGTTLGAYSTTGTLLGSDGKPVSGLPWNDLWKISLSDFTFSVPTITFNFIKNNTDSEVLAKPQLRISEGEKAQLIIGDKQPVPVTTLNTQQAIGGTGVIPITSFQYQDVGIKIEIEPRVHHNKEVTLKLTVEASNISGYVPNTSGPAQPIIGTRTITSTIRLRDGETNVFAGLIRKDTSQTKTGIPFLMDLPLIGPLFSDVQDTTKRTDLLLTLTPRIVRQPQITEEDLVPIWVGTENNVSFSGLSTRLESPNAPGSPFDGGAPAGRVPVPGAAPQAPAATPTMPNLPQGGAPSDPFRRPTTTTPSNPVPKGAANTAGGDESGPTASVASSAPAATVPVLLSLRADSTSLAVGEKTTVAVEGISGLAELNALELNLEWDPAVLEVSFIAPGSWQGQAPPGTYHFDAQRVAGSVRLQMNRNGASIGLPGGDLARLTVKAVGPGDTSIRLSTGSALGRSGGSRPAARAVLVSVRG